MGRLLVLPPTAADIHELAEKMRPADVAEVYASSGRDPLTAVKRSVAVSGEFCFAAYWDGELACIFGLAPFPVENAGAPWSLGTNVQDRRLKQFVKFSRGYLQDMLDHCPHLFNYVDARNTKSIRWLQRVGFTIHPARPYGAHGLPFHPFEMRA